MIFALLHCIFVNTGSLESDRRSRWHVLAISVNINHSFVRFNSTVFKIFICENRKPPFLCFKHHLFQHWIQNGLPYGIAKWSTLLNMHWAARYLHLCSLKQENYCLDTFYVCWVYKSAWNIAVYYKYVVCTERWNDTGVCLVLLQSKKVSNDQELIQSDPISCPQNQKGNN